VVSEETGSIAIAESGILDRPITSSRLREILETKLGNYRPTPLRRTVPTFNWQWLSSSFKNMVSRKSSEKK
jgi:hypothetical protein